ncbi:NAD(P)-dependent oxidoreductase [Paenarthrobacter nitroguajacolicus]
MAGAGLDVYDKEPLDTASELLDMEHVVCTTLG